MQKICKLLLMVATLVGRNTTDAMVEPAGTRITEAETVSA
jgi:hypothetical protein